MTDAVDRYVVDKFNGNTTEDYLDEVNDATRARISEFYIKHPETWLGNIDRNDVLWQYNDEFVCNFGADFAIPLNDEKLVKMIKERKARPYTGTKEDYPLITAIFDRIKELGGILLIWA